MSAALLAHIATRVRLASEAVARFERAEQTPGNVDGLAYWRRVLGRALDDERAAVRAVSGTAIETARDPSDLERRILAAPPTDADHVGATTGRLLPVLLPCHCGLMAGPCSCASNPGPRP